MKELKETVAKFEAVASKLDKLAIVITQIDPDAIASAFLLKKIVSQKFNKPTKIYYCGSREHAQNKAIWNLFNLDEIFEPITRYTKQDVALVDSSNTKDGRLGHTEIDPQSIKIVIDHHRDSDIKETENNFVFIEEVGAATTLVSELFFALNIELEENSPEATAGAIGIITDTHNTGSANKRDIKAFNQLFQKADLNKYQEVLNYDIPQEYFDCLTRALKNRQVHNGKLVTGIGSVPPDQEGSIAFVTDRLIRMAGVTLSIVWGITEDENKQKIIRITARSSDITQNLNDYLKKLFGENSGAKFEPDFHSTGGARIQLPNFLINSKTKDTLPDQVQKSMEYLVFGQDDEEIKTK